VLFNQPADSFIFGLLGISINSKTEALYYCIDTIRAPGVFKLLANSGIVIPPEVTQALATINQIQQSLNFLNIQFRFEGMMVTTANYAAYNLAPPTAWLDA
jgi:hypothetical protein